MNNNNFIKALRLWVDQIEEELNKQPDEEQDLDGWLTYMEYRLEDFDPEGLLEDNK